MNNIVTGAREGEIPPEDPPLVLGVVGGWGEPHSCGVRPALWVSWGTCLLLEDQNFKRELSRAWANI